MSNDMRHVKFEVLIKDIDEKMQTFFPRRWRSLFKKRNLGMLLIYDYDKLNAYGKIILEESSLDLNDWNNKYSAVGDLKDSRIRIDAAKELVRYCRMEEHRREAYKFIFWAMMILTVDKTNQEDSLSLICDFAKMLNISDDEMMDILHVIKKLYYPEMRESTFKSDTVPACFSEVMNLYN